MKKYIHPVQDSRSHDATRLYYASWWDGLRKRRLFRDVETYCLFIGYPRSGHSLVGSLLDAHPNVVIAHELDALGYVAAGFGRRQLFSLILARDQDFTANGREWSGYQYAVPSQWQGRFQALQVIGDKKGGLSTIWLQQRPELLEHLRRTVRARVRIIHVVRNPYDNIATILLRKQQPTIEQSAAWYFGMCRTVDRLIRQDADGSILTVRHEQVIADPQGCLRRLCEHVGVGCTDEYLNDCASIVFPSPHMTRTQVQWPAPLLQQVREQAAGLGFLSGYSYEQEPSPHAPAIMPASVPTGPAPQG